MTSQVDLKYFLKETHLQLCPIKHNLSFLLHGNTDEDNYTSSCDRVLLFNLSHHTVDDADHSPSVDDANDTRYLNDHAQGIFHNIHADTHCIDSIICLLLMLLVVRYATLIPGFDRLASLMARIGYLLILIPRIDLWIPLSLINLLMPLSMIHLLLLMPRIGCLLVPLLLILVPLLLMPRIVERSTVMPLLMLTFAIGLLLMPRIEVMAILLIDLLLIQLLLMLIIELLIMQLLLMLETTHLLTLTVLVSVFLIDILQMPLSLMLQGIELLLMQLFFIPGNCRLPVIGDSICDKCTDIDFISGTRYRNKTCHRGLHIPEFRRFCGCGKCSFMAVFEHTCPRALQVLIPRLDSATLMSYFSSAGFVLPADNCWRVQTLMILLTIGRQHVDLPLCSASQRSLIATNDETLVETQARKDAADDHAEEDALLSNTEVKSNTELQFSSLQCSCDQVSFGCTYEQKGATTICNPHDLANSALLLLLLAGDIEVNPGPPSGMFVTQYQWYLDNV